MARTLRSSQKPRPGWRSCSSSQRRLPASDYRWSSTTEPSRELGSLNSFWNHARVSDPAYAGLACLSDPGVHGRLQHPGRDRHRGWGSSAFFFHVPLLVAALGVSAAREWNRRGRRAFVGGCLGVLLATVALISFGANPDILLPGMGGGPLGGGGGR